MMDLDESDGVVRIWVDGPNGGPMIVRVDPALGDDFPVDLTEFAEQVDDIPSVSRTRTPKIDRELLEQLQAKERLVARVSTRRGRP